MFQSSFPFPDHHLLCFLVSMSVKCSKKFSPKTRAWTFGDAWRIAFQHLEWLEDSRFDFWHTHYLNKTDWFLMVLIACHKHTSLRCVFLYWFTILWYMIGMWFWFLICQKRILISACLPEQDTDFRMWRKNHGPPLLYFQTFYIFIPTWGDDPIWRS